MKYMVYKWNKDDVESYVETTETEFEIADNLTQSIIQYGTLVCETNDVTEAYAQCDKAQDDVGYYGYTSIFDTEEKTWFN